MAATTIRYTFETTTADENPEDWGGTFIGGLIGFEVEIERVGFAVVFGGGEGDGVRPQDDPPLCLVLPGRVRVLQLHAVE